MKNWPRTLRFTRLGVYVVILTFGIGFSAINTGNNLVYMVFGLLLGFITASGVLSEMSLRRIRLNWILPPELYAETPATMLLMIKNSKKKFPSFALKVEV